MKYPIATVQKKFLGTIGARPEKKDHALLDISSDTNQKCQEVNQNVSHEEIGTPEQYDYI